MTCCFMLCCGVVCHVALCQVMLCYIMLSHAMLCCVLLWAICADFLYVFRKFNRLHERKLWFLLHISVDGTILQSFAKYFWTEGILKER